MLTNFLVTKSWAIRTESISRIEILTPCVRFYLNNGEHVSYDLDDMDYRALLKAESKTALGMLAEFVFDTKDIGKIDLEEIISETYAHLKAMHEMKHGYDYDKNNR